MEETKKKSPIGLIIAIVLIVAALCGGLYLGKAGCTKCRENKEEKQAEKQEKKEETKEEIKEETKPTESQVDTSNLSDRDYAYMKDLIHMHSDTIFGYHSYEDVPKGKIADLPKEDKQYIIYWTGSDFNYLGTVYGEKEGDYCYAGSGSCRVITKENYYKVAKKYNITDSFEDLYSDFNIVDDTAYYTYGGWVQPQTFLNNIKNIKYDGNNVIFEVETFVYKYDDYSNRLATLNIKYTFNKLADGNYALYSIDY